MNTSQHSLARRETEIRDLCMKSGAVCTSELASYFGVSQATIRRDLDALERKSYVRRTSRGAVLNQKMIFEFDYPARQERNVSEKRAIARVAREFIRPGQRVILDAGTTTLALASLLTDAEDLTVVTPSLAIADLLQHASKVQVVLLWGVLRRGSPDVSGFLTERCVESLSVDMAFQGVNGVGLDGSVYNADPALARLAKLIRKRAERSFLLADASKIGQSHSARSGSLREFDTFITSAGVTEDALTRLKRFVGKILIADDGAKWLCPRDADGPRANQRRRRVGKYGVSAPSIRHRRGSRRL